MISSQEIFFISNEKNNIWISSHLEKRSTWNETNLPSKFTGLLRSSVISIDFLSSPSEFKNNTLPRHVEGSGVSFWSFRRDTGNCIVTGFKNSSNWLQIIRSIGLRNKSCPSNSSLGTSCTWSNRKWQNYMNLNRMFMLISENLARVVLTPHLN